MQDRAEHNDNEQHLSKSIHIKELLWRFSALQVLPSVSEERNLQIQQEEEKPQVWE